MTKKGKQLRAAYEKVDKTQAYDIKEALNLLREGSYAKFDETVEVSYHLGIDTRKNDQQIRGAMVLPKGTGKTATVLVFTQGEKVQEAQEAGADYVGDDEYIQRIQDGWFDFDTIIATPDMMGKIGRLGRILGPKGLMPNPKTGTVTTDVAKAVENVKAGQVEYRADNGSNVHVAIGKLSFSDEDLLENLRALHDTIVRSKPASSKGTYILNLSLTSTMGPGIKIDPATI